MRPTLPRSRILTHRGLEPDNPNFWPESSYEAFADHISRGFGIEFDLNFCKDDIVISHDPTLTRITEGQDKRAFRDISVRELQKLRYGTKQGRIATLDEIMDLIDSSAPRINAMHLKGPHQIAAFVDHLVEVLPRYKNIFDRFFIFDLKPHIAKFVKEKIPELQLAPSVAHPYDIKRYNDLVGGTLLSVDQAVGCRDIYDWVWLDEWDREDRGGGDKTLCNRETFETLRAAGFKIALVTPEMHSLAAPGILGGKTHEDAEPGKFLVRMKEIIRLDPDAICTDHPETFAE